MNEGMVRLAQAADKKNQVMRLENWGRWTRRGSAPGLGLPTWGSLYNQFIPDQSNSITVNDLDAQKIEHVISSLDVAGRGGFGWGELWGAVLRIEYSERDSKNQRPVAVRAKHVSRKFKRPCAARTYYHHLQNATRAVFQFTDSL